MPIAITSFLVASFLPRIGIKRGMLMALAMVAIICFMIPLVADEFWYFKLLFMVIGISFAIIKVGVFSSIGLVTEGPKEHSSLMSSIEGFFMVGVLFGNLFFSFFIDDANPKSTQWLQLFYYLGVLTLMAFVFLWLSEVDESAAKDEDMGENNFMEMIKLVLKPLVLVFVLSAFLFVLIEQSFSTWMPTFYNDVLKVPASMGVQAGSILAGAFALGRLGAGPILKRMHWLTFVLICLALLSICIVINLPLAKGVTISENVNWLNAPLIAYIFPLMGLFLAPIYPTVNSTILSSLPKYMHSSMSGLIVVFSALGGTTGSMITGFVFENYDGGTAFYMSLFPIGLMVISLIMLNRLINQKKLQTN